VCRIRRSSAQLGSVKVEVEPRERVREVLKESEFQKLRRDITLGSVEEAKAEKRRILQRKRIDDLKLSSRITKSRRPTGRGGAARESSRRRTGKSVCYYASAYRGW
jgi:hypothetical protein